MSPCIALIFFDAQYHKIHCRKTMESTPAMWQLCKGAINMVDFQRSCLHNQTAIHCIPFFFSLSPAPQVVLQ